MGYSPFPDVEPALMVVLDPEGYTVTTTPIDLKDILTGTGVHTAPSDVLRIQRVGGAHGDNRATDYPRVTIDCFSLRRESAPRAAHQRARSVEARVLSLADVVTVPDDLGGGTVRISGDGTESGPVEFPWPDPDIQVVRLIVRVSTRR